MTNFIGLQKRIKIERINKLLKSFQDADPTHPDHKSCDGVPKKEVCGTDLKTYDNMCTYRNASFWDPSLRIKFNGSCDGKKFVRKYY